MKKEIFYRIYYVVHNSYGKLYSRRSYPESFCKRNSNACKLVTYELKEINRDK